jgi:Na+-translocating ferredoxin:NAD+ oxidoreductase RnfD subunit
MKAAHPTEAKWTFSIALGIAYLLTFHLWRHLHGKAMLASGVAVVFLFAVWFLIAKKRREFLNDWDAGFHAMVILDLLLEALLIPAHQGYGFYLCALGFAAVIGSYRWYLLRRLRMKAVQPGG